MVTGARNAGRRRSAWFARLVRALLVPAVVLGVLSAPAAAQAAGTATVAVAAQCTFSGNAVGSYVLLITLHNDTDRWATIVHSQVTGAVSGPTGLADGGTGAPGDVGETSAGPFPGDAVGTATVTFDLRLQGRPEGTLPPEDELVTVSAAVDLDGRCQGPGPGDLFSATVTPTTVPVGGTIVVSGGHCPPSAGWNLGVAPTWIVDVQLVRESHPLTIPPTGSGFEAVAIGVAPPPFPGSVRAQTEVDPLGGWSAILDLSATDQPAGPGTYAVSAVCTGGNSLIGSIVYDTPRITVVAPITAPVVTPVAAQPSFTG